MLTYEIGFLDSKNDSFNPLILEILLLFSILGVSNGPKLDVNSHAPGRKVFATARMLGVLLEFSAM